MFRTNPQLAWGIVLLLSAGHLIWHGLIKPKRGGPAHLAGMAIAALMLVISGLALIFP